MKLLVDKFVEKGICRSCDDNIMFTVNCINELLIRTFFLMYDAVMIKLR